MIDIKQQELDKAFTHGVVLTETAIFDVIRRHVSPDIFKAAAVAVHGVLLCEIGKDRLEAIQGVEEVRA